MEKKFKKKLMLVQSINYWFLYHENHILFIKLNKCYGVVVEAMVGGGNNAMVMVV